MMNRLVMIFSAFLLFSCAEVTLLRTEEIRSVETNLRVKIDSLGSVIDSLSNEQISQNRRIQADLRLLLNTLAEGNDKLEARLEEQQFLLDKISQEKKSTPKIRLSPALSKQAIPTEEEPTDSIPTEGAPVDSLIPTGVDSASGTQFDLEQEQAYSKAKSDYNAENYKEAFLGFKTIYEKDPIGKLAENSLFWMGNAYGKTGQGPKAITIYERLIQEFPEGAKMCASQFQIAKIYGEMNEKEKQLKTYKSLVAEKNCVGTNEAFRAQQELGKSKD